MLWLGGCNGDQPAAPAPLTFLGNPCSASGTVTLAEAQATRVDCSNGGTTVSLAGGGASYLLVPQFATDQGTNQLVSYSVASASLSAASAARSRPPAAWTGLAATPPAYDGFLPPARPYAVQLAADRLLRARQRVASGEFARIALRVPVSVPTGAVQAPPVPGSIRSFQVLSNFNTVAW